MWRNAWFGAASLTNVTVSVSAYKGDLRPRIIILKSNSGCINAIKYKVSNGGTYLAADCLWSTNMYLEISVGVDQCDCASTTGNSKLDTVSCKENGRSCARKYNLPLAMVDEEHHQAAEDSIARPPMWEVDEEWRCIWGGDTLFVELLRGKPLEVNITETLHTSSTHCY